MSAALLIFAATFLSVFTLGLQSLNVNQGQYCAAIVTSFFIGSGHILLYRYMPGAAAGELAGYYLGGMAGIASSIWFHKRAKAWIAAWSERRRSRPAMVQPRAPLPWPTTASAPDEHRDVASCGDRMRYTDNH